MKNSLIFLLLGRKFLAVFQVSEHDPELFSDDHLFNLTFVVHISRSLSFYGGLKLKYPLVNVSADEMIHLQGFSVVLFAKIFYILYNRNERVRRHLFLTARASTERFLSPSNNRCT